MNIQEVINILAPLWFCGMWIGYTVYARRKVTVRHSLSSVLHLYRREWMLIMMHRDNRITDTALIASLERNASFLASAAMFVIAGLVTITASIEQVHNTLAGLPFSNELMTPLQLQLKIVLLLAIYVYAFFSLTWAMRQYGFCAILIGAAPLHNDEKVTEAQRAAYAYNTARVVDNAGQSYNYGLRAFYFSLSILPWFFHPVLFMVAVTFVVAILYRREFNSRILKSLTKDLHTISRGNAAP